MQKNMKKLRQIIIEPNTKKEEIFTIKRIGKLNKKGQTCITTTDGTKVYVEGKFK